MKDHLASALLCGWLLMQPPLSAPGSVARPTEKVESKTWGALYDRPITEWDHVASFDTAAQCESMRTRLNAEKAKVPGANDAGTPANALYGQVLFARCIPADHIYPPRSK